MKSTAKTLTNSTTSRHTQWTFLSGPRRGQTQIVASEQVHIGRGDDCDVIIPEDPKCSRTHAVVTWTPDGFEIQRMSDKNSLLVNGAEVTRTVLQTGMTITLGDTELRFQQTNTAVSTSVNTSMTPPTRPKVNSPSSLQATVVGFPTQTNKKSLPSRSQGGSMMRWVMWGGVGLLLWLLFSPSGDKKSTSQIRSEEQIEVDIETAKKLAEAARSQRRNQDNNISYKQAQESYIKGFRDYRKGQYERALESFQACLSFYPEHVLCNRYLRLSQRKFNELVQYQSVLGRKYRDQNQFSACRAAFRNVMTMVKDQTSPTYKEAKANFEACDALVEGRF